MSRSSLNQLSVLLWQERDILGKLASRLDQQAEVDRLAYSVRWLELERAMVTREVAEEVGVHGDPSLAELIAAASPEWRDVLADHRDALLALADDLTRPRERSAAVAGNGAAHRFPRRSLPRFRVQRSLRDFLA